MAKYALQEKYKEKEKKAQDEEKKQVRAENIT